MSKPRNIQKRIFALLAAAIMLTGFSPEVFAEESEKKQGVNLSEVKEENSDIGEKLEVPVDFSDLEMQIALANGLNKREYSKVSWDALENAIADGLKLINGNPDQKTVSEAAEAIEKAVEELVKIDYSKLEKALGIVYNIVDENSVQHDLWSRIDSAAENARAVLVSGNQEAVDKATDELNALAEEFLQSGMTVEPEVIVNTVEVEVPPSDDFCNIAMHRVWPILFVLSFVLNLAMIGFIAYMIVRKKNTEDNIPLVSYDIDDDMYDYDDVDDEIIDDEDYYDEDEDDNV
ncbi:MAG: FIVAR domain-containing protein [Oscillospiraceae bacterium]|nr:FIVAR domain-containing protein [Oscillospiraceae bacterium]